MSGNFFVAKCKESARTNPSFGICDDQNGSKAYTSTTNAGKWIATVKNSSNIPVTFTAIDNCIIIFMPGTKNKVSTCDGLLTFANSLYLVELKIQGTGGWIATAVTQLESTIKLITASGISAKYKYKKAFACNRKHPYFQKIDNEFNKHFFRTYGFRIDIQAKIVIK